MIFNKTTPRNLLLTLSVLGLVLGFGSFFSLGLTIVGLLDFTKFYIPLMLALIFLDRYLNGGSASKYFKKILFMNVVYIVVLIILVLQFSY